MSACAATGRAATRSCCCPTSTSCRPRPSAGRHDPFAADIADGYVYGRGAVDMKDMIALELGVIERLVAEARAAGLDPARDPIPGLRRDVLFTCASDEEAGGEAGVKAIAVHHPEWLRAAGAVNEAGGVSVTVAGRRLYPIQVAEKGFAPMEIRVRGTWGHGSMPRDDNAAVLAARVVERLAAPGPVRITPVMAAVPRRGGGGPPRRAGERPAPAGERRPGGAMPSSTGCASRCTRGPCARSSATPCRRTSSMPGSSTTSSRATRSSRSTSGSCRA